jgi:hypothetical protein
LYCSFKFINFLNDRGIDVAEILNQIHEILGLPPYPRSKNTRRGEGVSGLINDVIAVLPTEELKALFDKKLETSKDFKDLVEAIQSPEFAVNIQHPNHT